MTGNPVPSLVLLSAVTSLAFCALHIVVPALPLLVLAFNDSPARVQLVLIFRPSAELPQIVDEALAHLPNLLAVWTQKGIVHEAAAARARGAGRIVIQDRCIRTQHLFSKFGQPAASPRE